MKRWAFITVLLYLLILVALTVPVLYLAFSKWWWLNKSSDIQLTDAFEVFQEWSYWVWLGLMGFCQALLLFTPVRIAQRRLPARRPLLIPTITTALLLANLFLWGVMAAASAIFKEKAFDVFAYLGEIASYEALSAALSKRIVGTTISASTNNLEYIFGAIAAIAMLWLMWAIIFYFFVKTDDPNSLMKRCTRWLIRGSILELLIAIPSHIIVRNRDTCCAPFGSFWGITTGLSVMILAFGPGVFFLFAERVARLQPKHPPPSAHDPPSLIETQSS